MAEDDEPGSWVYLVYLSTLAPWAVVQVYDAIDAKLRHVNDVPVRLAVSLFLITASTVVGLWYVSWSNDRSRTESATMLVGVAINSWHWKRNVRGWRSYGVLVSQRVRISGLITRFMGMRLQGMMSSRNLHRAERGDDPPSKEYWDAHWGRLWMNDMVIDNDPRTTPISLGRANWHAIIGGDVLWRMFWLQGAVGKPLQDVGAMVDDERRVAPTLHNPPCHGQKALIREEALDQLIRDKVGDTAGTKSVPALRMMLGEMSKSDQDLLDQQASDNSKNKEDAWTKPTVESRRLSLEAYDVGQQDIGGLPPTHNNGKGSLSSLWVAMSWVTGSAPLPMENIWYECSALVDVLQKHAIPSGSQHDSQTPWPRFPIVSEWNHIAGDLARLREIPLLLSVREARRYALRLASISALLAYHYDSYMDLCRSVYQLGITARWTHGWSGLVSCYSKYWTLGNVSVALLGGLSLLIVDGDWVGNASVQCLLVGLASENIMSTYLSDARRAARTKELGRRYYLNKGKTCRGSGVRCIRDALEALKLPRSASQLDGVIAFSSGWAMEAVLGLPGNQKPREGNDHDQIEDLFCSSRAYRFPDERL